MSIQEGMVDELEGAASRGWQRRSITDEGLSELQASNCMSGFSSHLNPGRPYWPNGAVLPSPVSQINSPAHERSDSLNAPFNVSTSFNTDTNTDACQTDLIILSSDSVLFYVHSACLLAASENGFNTHLPLTTITDTFDNDAIIAVPESSSIINLLLHAVYAWPCTRYSPSFEHLSEVVATLNVYGISISTFLAPGSPLFDALLVYAHTRPLDLYALSASFGIHQLAVSASAHLLSLSLCSLTDDMAVKIGPIYLKKLFFLHLGRLEALKRLLHPPPHSHTPTSSCDSEEQKKLTRSWALASAYLMWNAQPYTSPNTIDKALCSLANYSTCDLCKLSLQGRIRKLVVQWSVVKCTII